MNARANSSSGPKADGSHPVAYAILAGVAVGLLLPVVGYLLDPYDTTSARFSPLRSQVVPSSLFSFGVVSARPRFFSLMVHLRAATRTLTPTNVGPRMFGRRNPSTLYHSVLVAWASGLLTPSGLSS